ncbi:MAG: TetR/AcrR family transcriptional regulator [Bacteroidota bacterium]
MKKRTHLTPEARRNQILAAADLVLLEVGIDQFSVNQVIAKAGIAKGTVYNYYRSKDDMLADLGIKALRLMLEYFVKGAKQKSDAGDKLEAICVSSYRYYRDFPQYFDLIAYTERAEFALTEESYLSFREDIYTFFNQIIEEGKQKGELSTKYNTTLTYYNIWASCVGILQFIDSKPKVFLPETLNTEDMMRSHARMMVAGMRA